ncbi:integrase [Kitasatospora phosalacinea]|uniref:Integrase n=1 Tax=Kitasatospora phosalacinea TaxID=2065 RepID=A0A9W6UN80_9ACTN|nr:integrase [Kitasatospora phosalacinea]
MAVTPGELDLSVARRALQAKLAQFPARTNPPGWQATELSRTGIVDQIRVPAKGTQGHQRCWTRRHGADALLQWLEAFPGSNWQQRWDASPAPQAAGYEWLDAASQWTRDQPGVRDRARSALAAGALTLYALDVVRPGLDWLLHRQSRHFREIMADQRDPEGFAELEALAGPEVWSSSPGLEARGQIARLLAAKGGTIRDITVGDCIETREIQSTFTFSTGALFYRWLRSLDIFPPDAPASLRYHSRRVGQLSPADMVDRYQIQCRPVRDLLVAYLMERQPSLDHTSLDDLSRVLACHFWANLERHHPGIDNLRLPPQIAAAWKDRIRVKRRRERQPDGRVIEVESPRVSYIPLITSVRAFYLDIAQWAVDDPAQWSRWAAPCPISDSEINYKKLVRQQKARKDERTRARLPVLPILVRAADEARKAARDRLDAMRAVPAGEIFTVFGETFRRAASRRKGSRSQLESTWVFDAEGRRRDLGWEEHRGFWSWVAVEFLRHTGVRIEEMLEVTHHSLVQYTLPTTGEVVPLLQIAPSKTDEERVLLVSPELADVLSAVVFRVRGLSGVIPLVELYDQAEKQWTPPMPALFQAPDGGHHQPIAAAVIRRFLNHLLTLTGLTDNTGQPLQYQPHDFRRIFVTDAIMSGLPPHIAQIICGHGNINTTVSYKAIYPQEAIEAHRAFIARRRSLRPSEEYRTPTSEEWDAFLGHFERRKLSIGTCGRAFGTDCIHEHACIRCSMLRPDPAQRSRLAEIHDNLIARIEEAKREGWLGDVEGLEIHLAGATQKLAQLDAEADRKQQAIHLGMPSFPDSAAVNTSTP